MNTDEFHLPAWVEFLGPTFFIVVAVLIVLWFPFVAALVAPDDRKIEFFILTLLVLWGPLGVACAAVANPRP